MLWPARKKTSIVDSAVQTTPEVVTPRDQAVRDLMSFFRGRGTSVPDAIQYSAFFIGFAVANFVSAKGTAETDPETQQLLKLAHDAIDEGLGAVRTALESDVGRALRANKHI